MKDLMIDIETMGTGNNAVMIQLAGVFFNKDTGETGDEFCMGIDVKSCLDWGFVTTQETIDWWANQDQNILRHIQETAYPVDHVIEWFYDFYKNTKGDIKIWSHATFDFVIVQNYLAKIGKHMVHKNARDIRTLVDLSGIDLKKYDWKMKTHDALDDCKFQIKYCVDAMKLIKDMGSTI